MSPEPAIECENVTKDFVLVHNAQQSLKTRFVGLFHKRWRATRQTFRALDDVSLTVGKGEALGVMGKNGSGKSTLLSLIAGIYPPSAGRIAVRGRLVPLIALGVGFHPELTGEENIYLNASLFGFKNPEIRAMFADIWEFSELGGFIHEPFKTYSTGMGMRLAFAVAVHMDPDIMLADEILSVGDSDFQLKCLERVQQLRRNGMTLLFVSHGLGQVQEFCDRYIYLEAGKIIDTGNVKDLSKNDVQQNSKEEPSQRQRTAAAY